MSKTRSVMSNKHHQGAARASAPVNANGEQSGVRPEDSRKPTVSLRSSSSADVHKRTGTRQHEARTVTTVQQQGDVGESIWASHRSMNPEMFASSIGYEPALDGYGGLSHMYTVEMLAEQSRHQIMPPRTQPRPARYITAPDLQNDFAENQAIGATAETELDRYMREQDVAAAQRRFARSDVMRRFQDDRNDLQFYRWANDGARRG